MKKLVGITLLIASLVTAAFFMRAPELNPPYTIEIRHVAPDGIASFEPQDYKIWNHEANIAGLRKHTDDVIYHSVYWLGLQYCFSESGRVYAMAGSENNLPSLFDKEWRWLGDPHEFPHYDYSKASPLVKP